MILLAVKTNCQFCIQSVFCHTWTDDHNYIVHEIVGYPVILSFCLSPSMSRLCGACIVDCDSVVFALSYSKLAF